MKLLKLTAYSFLLFSYAITMSSCEKEAEKKKVTDFSRTNIVLSGAQEVPANPSTGTGSMNVSYSKSTHTLAYSVKWTLPTAPTLMHIHGLAPVGYATGVVQNILTSSNPTLFPASGSYSGTMYVDGVTIKEQDLLNGMYYLNIHTTTYPGGEIRGQIVFQ